MQLLSNSLKPTSKSKKTTTAQKQGKTQGRWTTEEHERFLTGKWLTRTIFDSST